MDLLESYHVKKDEDDEVSKIVIIFWAKSHYSESGKV